MIEQIERLKKDPFYKRYFLKFKKADYEYLDAFIVELENMPKEEAVQVIAHSAMRENKPRNWTAIEELLSVAIKL